MAYSTSLPPLLLASVKDGSTPQLWVYPSADESSVIIGADYFSNGVNLGMRLGDNVILTATANGYATQLVTVASISGAAVTVRYGGQLATQAQAGITGGTGTVYLNSVSRIGNIIHTRILIGLTGLNSGGTAGDIIGVDGASSCHIGRITTARNGTIFAGRMTCFTVAVTGSTDIDLYSAAESTGAEDAAGAALTETQLINAGIMTAQASAGMTAFPAAGEYLYLVGQTATSATYTAGVYMIEMFGY